MTKAAAAKPTETFSVTVNVPVGVIANTLASAFEGGANYWIAEIDPKAPPAAKLVRHFPGLGNGVYPHIDYPLSEGGRMLMKCSEDQPNPARKDGRWVLDRAAIAKGLGVMAAKYPRHFNNMIDEEHGNADAETGDVFVQCCFFGEIVFG
jgi:hypothetical protein